jgi:hypothetical protein
MPQLPAVGATGWGTTLNTFLETAHDNTSGANGGKVKAAGIIGGTEGQVLTTTASGVPAWGSATGGMQHPSGAWNLSGSTKWVPTIVPNNTLTIPPFVPETTLKSTSMTVTNINGILIIGATMDLTPTDQGQIASFCLVYPGETESILISSRKEYKLDLGVANRSVHDDSNNNSTVPLPIFAPKDSVIKLYYANLSIQSNLADLSGMAYNFILRYKTL